MTDDHIIDQRDQTIHGSQTNIGKADKVFIHESARSAPPIPRQIPSPPLDFSGREDELNELISQFDRGATIIGLRGMGGIGKTSLALVLADVLKNRFPDGQIFVQMAGTSDKPLTPAEAQAHVIRSYQGIDVQLPRGESELGSLYRTVLDGKRVLFLFDNAFGRPQVEPLLPPTGSAILITSRQKFTLPGMPDPFLLKPLEPKEACDFLLKICPRINGYASELTKLCGYLPLALRAAASLLAVESDLKPKTYLEELQSERTRLEKIGNEGVDLDVEASFNLSYRRLMKETAHVFRQLPVFPTDFDAAAEEEICQDEGHRHLRELVRWSLVDYQEDMCRYVLHDLVSRQY